MLYRTDLLQITRRQQSLEKESEIAEEWRTLASVIDRLLFLLSLMSLIVVAVWMTVLSTQRPDIPAHAVIADVTDHSVEADSSGHIYVDGHD